MALRTVVRQQASRRVVTGTPSDLWDWSMWIEGPFGALLPAVRRVVYSLHPAFPNPNRVVKDPAGGFRLDVRSDSALGTTWGTFTVHVRVGFADGTFERHEVRLQLDSPAAPVRGLLDMEDDDPFDVRWRLVERLKAKGAFGYARDALDRYSVTALNPSQREWVVQQRALCTYKDPQLPLATRLTDAFDILEGDGRRLATSTDPETLGLAGAILKRMWEVDGQRLHLERSLELYRRGFDEMLAHGQERNDYDGGAFAGVNAAYVADLLAVEAPSNSATQAAMIADARRVRDRLVAALTALPDGSRNWWTLNSLAQTYLAQASTDTTRYHDCGSVLTLALASPNVTEWELETTATQLRALVDVHARLWPSEAQRIRTEGLAIVARLYPAGTLEAAALRGKVGLALSGGGFRASLFHIGVLARLAERDLLRHVEVLSCVSGGSIVGAHYYLELKRLLESKGDAAISASDYAAIVSRMEREFLAGVQDNIRVRLAADLEANWKMLLHPRRYSRTRRTGELYEERIFRRVEDGDGSHPRWLNELFVTPVGADGRPEDGFSPRLNNWRRRAKVPILILNATTLNAGRNFQFTASSMGESASYGTAIDGTPQLNQVYYSEAPAAHRDVRLGHAVAASSCVPGLFDPLVLEGLYPDRVVRLVDGGVHDNQGARALLDQDCSVLFVSDASGQMAEDRDPSQGALGVLLRTNGVLQARLRVAQHQEIDARQRGGLARAVVFTHLKEELASGSIDALPLYPDERADDDAALTSYRIRRDVQRALADIRTDLDSFTQAEAYALMTSGYRIAERAIAGCDALESVTAADDRQPWEFLSIEPVMRGEDAVDWSTGELLRHLRVGAQLGFKVWSLDPLLRVLRWMLALVAVGGVAYWAIARPLVRLHWDVDIRMLLVAAAILALGYYWQAGGQVAGWIRKLIDYRSTVMRIAGGLAMGIAGWALAWLHLLAFDARFKSLGSVAGTARAADPLDPSPRRRVVARVAEGSQRRVRPKTTVIAYLAAAAVLVGILPLVRFLDWYSSGAAISAAALAAIVLAIAARSTDTRLSEATEKPGPGEWLLAWCSALQEGALAGIMPLLFYGMTYVGTRSWNWLAGMMTWSFTLDPSVVAFRVALVMAAAACAAAASMTAEKIQRTLYPSTAGAKSAYLPLLQNRRQLLAIGGIAAIVFVTLLVLFPGAWGTAIAAAVLFYTTMPLDAATRPRQARERASVADIAAAVFRKNGYDILLSPRTGNPEVDPLIHGVMLLATSGATTFALEVKDLTSSSGSLAWTAASPLRTAATVLQQELARRSAATSVRPVLLVVGGEISAGLQRFSSLESVGLAHLPKADGPPTEETVTAALARAGVVMPAPDAATATHSDVAGSAVRS